MRRKHNLRDASQGQIPYAKSHVVSYHRRAAGRVLREGTPFRPSWGGTCAAALGETTVVDPAYIPPTPRPPLRASRALAAFLSFLVPGTGQLVAGRVIAGLLFLLPVVVAIVAGVIAAGGDRGRLAGVLVQPSVLLGIVLLLFVVIRFLARDKGVRR